MEDLCFDVQQAAEKALKGLLLHLEVSFPYTHDLADLIHTTRQK
ncbi:HEPN domain-containing protein [Salinibacter ruber]